MSEPTSTAAGDSRGLWTCLDPRCRMHKVPISRMDDDGSTCTCGKQLGWLKSKTASVSSGAGETAEQIEQWMLAAGNAICALTVKAAIHEIDLPWRDAPGRIAEIINQHAAPAIREATATLQAALAEMKRENAELKDKLCTQSKPEIIADTTASSSVGAVVVKLPKPTKKKNCCVCALTLEAFETAVKELGFVKDATRQKGVVWWSNERAETAEQQLVASRTRERLLENELRGIMWGSHGHDGLYGDDGEMQCCQCSKYGCTDYKREPLEKVRTAYTSSKLAPLSHPVKPPGA